MTWMFRISGPRHDDRVDLCYGWRKRSQTPDDADEKSLTLEDDAHLSVYLSACLYACLSVCLDIFLPTYTYLLTYLGYLPTYLPTTQPTNLPIPTCTYQTTYLPT